MVLGEALFDCASDPALFELETCRPAAYGYPHVMPT